MSATTSVAGAREPLAHALDRWRERVERELDRWLPADSVVPETEEQDDILGKEG